MYKEEEKRKRSSHTPVLLLWEIWGMCKCRINRVWTSTINKWDLIHSLLCRYWEFGSFRIDTAILCLSPFFIISLIYHPHFKMVGGPTSHYLLCKLFQFHFLINQNQFLDFQSELVLDSLMAIWFCISTVFKLLLFYWYVLSSPFKNNYDDGDVTKKTVFEKQNWDRLPLLAMSSSCWLTETVTTPETYIFWQVLLKHSNHFTIDLLQVRSEKII